MKLYAVYFIQGLAIIFLTPFFSGFIRTTKAYLRGYKGPGLLQSYYDLARLFRKGKVISKSSSFITQIGPSLSLAAVITTAFLIPVFYVNPENYLGNIFMIIFLLGIVKFFNSLMGLDCASTFGGMGSSRELFLSMLAEPVIFILIIFLFFDTKSFNISKIAFINSSAFKYSIGHLIAGAAFFIVLLIENARLPVDNPETHLELTMIHEAMILDLSGRDLAFAELASSIKLMLFLSIFISAFIPIGTAATLAFIPLLKAVIIYFAKVLVSLTIIAVIETSMAKSRLFRIPELTAVAFSISVAAITINYFI